MNSFYTEDELRLFNFVSLGKNVLISKKSSFYSANEMSFGNNVRIDDFCILSGKITLHSNIHISAYTALYGKNEIELEDYSGLSPRCTVFSVMDDFSGDFLIGPIHDKKLTNVTGGKVLIQKFVQIGAGSVIFPNLTVGAGSVVGAMSLVNKSLDRWGIYVGIPVSKRKERKQNLLNLI